jgi:homocysteine S-methyltransferase
MTMSENSKNPFAQFLEQQGVLVLDGGLATELEVRGFDLDDPMWSARLLLDDPDAIRQLHADYLSAGADCIISASYQGTISGFMRLGMSEGQAKKLLNLSVQLAIEARDAFWSQVANQIGRLRPIIAASVGPYGAALADGSEYTGDYDLDEEGLLAFHRPRWQILAESEADILACETIPSMHESRALARLLVATPERYGWFSFSCQDGRRISDGSLLADCLAPLNKIEKVVAVGINCTSPKYIPSLIGEAQRVTDKPIIVYPNSGERYEAGEKRWLGTAEANDFAGASELWCTSGANIIGGCCRTGPDHVRQIRRQLIAQEQKTVKEHR